VESTTEPQLVARAKAGDTAAFEGLLAPHIDRAHRLACALLQDPSLAEDAVQEACLRAWRKLGHLRPGSPFLPWFLGIVANQCRDQMRGRWWQVIRTPDTRLTSDEPPEAAALRRAELREALLRLGDRDRRLIIVRLYLDLPWSEVAAVAGLTPAGARARYYRALDRLRSIPGSQEVLT